MIDEDLREFLVSLNTGAGERVHVGNVEFPNAYPAIVLIQGGGATPRTLGGNALFTSTPFSIHVLHTGKQENGTGGYADAHAVAKALRDALNALPRGLLGSTYVQSARITAEPVDASNVDGDKVTRWLQQELLIVHR